MNYLHNNHSMGCALLPYVQIKIHPLIRSFTGSKIIVRGKYDRIDSIISSQEKNDKLFNWKRPTVEFSQDHQTLYVNCFPGVNYVDHYAALITIFYSLCQVPSPEIMIDYPSRIACLQQLQDFNLDALPDSDIIIVGKVENLQLLTDQQWQGGNDVYWSSKKIYGKNVTLLGCAFSIWGDIAGDLVRIVSQTKVKVILYTGKLGGMSENNQLLANQMLATGTTSLVNGKIIKWPQLITIPTHITNVMQGNHITLFSPIAETNEWFKLHSKDYSFVDPEIGHMALAAQECGIQFSYLHIISDILGNPGDENLSNERDSRVIEKRKKLHINILNILDVTLKNIKLLTMWFLLFVGIDSLDAGPRVSRFKNQVEISLSEEQPLHQDEKYPQLIAFTQQHIVQQQEKSKSPGRDELLWKYKHHEKYIKKSNMPLYFFHDSDLDSSAHASQSITQKSLYASYNDLPQVLQYYITSYLVAVQFKDQAGKLWDDLSLVPVRAQGRNKVEMVENEKWKEDRYKAYYTYKRWSDESLNSEDMKFVQDCLRTEYWLRFVKRARGQYPMYNNRMQPSVLVTKAIVITMPLDTICNKKYYPEGIETAALMIACGALVNDTSKYALSSAIRQDNIAMVRLLMHAGLTTVMDSKTDETLMHIAAGSGALKMINYFHSKGYDLNAQNNMYLYTPLRRAYWFEKHDAVELLIKLGANIDLKDCYNRTYNEGGSISDFEKCPRIHE